jgi:hypothetical protein
LPQKDYHSTNHNAQELLDQVGIGEGAGFNGEKKAGADDIYDK